MPDTLLLRAGSPDAPEIFAAAEILKRGGIVAIPTETVYGLAADGMNPEAVAKIFKAKGRPQDNPLILHIAELDWLGRVASYVPEAAKKLAAAFWPGPLTIILPKRPEVPYAVTAGLETVAVRFPSHPIAHAVIAAAGTPLAAPSANLSGRPSPTSWRHCAEDLTGRVDAIVCDGDCDVGLESTVVTLAGETPRLLRPGGITAEQLRSVLGRVDIDDAVLSALAPGAVAASPGMKYKHYAPKASVVIVDADAEVYAGYVNAHAGDGVFALCFDEDIPQLKTPYISCGSACDEGAHAHRLFNALRELDERGARIAYARKPSSEGVGLAVYNRLLRAAGFNVVKPCGRDVLDTYSKLDIQR